MPSFKSGVQFYRYLGKQQNIQDNSEIHLHDAIYLRKGSNVSIYTQISKIISKV